MRLNESSRKIIFGNIELLKYCRDRGISTSKLEKCNIERMGDVYVFVLSKENTGIDIENTLLEYDIETQPDVVLTMEYTGEKCFRFETTSFTQRVLNAEKRG